MRRSLDPYTGSGQSELREEPPLGASHLSTHGGYLIEVMRMA